MARRTASIERRHAVTVLAVGLAFATGLLLHVEALNGLRTWTRWEWPWRDLDLLPTAGLLLPPLLIVAWVVWRSETARSRVETWVLLTLLVLANFALQVLGILADPQGIALIEKIVASPSTTSYFTDAGTIRDLSEWLRWFHEANLHFHSSTHPPGPILFYHAFLKAVGPDAARVAGCAVGWLGSLSVPLIFVLAGVWTHDLRARLTAAALYTVLPALVLVFPEFDQAFPILSMLLIVLWVKALDAPRLLDGRAAALGAAVFATTFTAYHVLATGAFLVLYGLYWIGRARGSRAAWRKLAATCGVALAVAIGLHAVLARATGFDAIASFLSAVEHQETYERIMQRPYLALAVFDLYDLLLGAGMIAMPLLLLHLRRDPPALSVIAVATILTIDLSGLFAGEVARVWLFLQPLLIVPAALELARYPRGWRLAVLATQWGVLVCLKARVSFVSA